MHQVKVHVYSTVFSTPYYLEQLSMSVAFIQHMLHAIPWMDFQKAIGLDQGFQDPLAGCDPIFG